MNARDPEEWVNEPMRRALDGVLYRWLALFCAPVAVAVVHRLNDVGWIDEALHLGLPAFLVGYIVVHLVGRLFWRGRDSSDGWMRAEETDRVSVAVTRTIGWVAVIGTGLAMIATLGTLHEPKELLMEVLVWFMLYFPLYAVAVWVTIDCAHHRLARGVNESRRRIQAYWHELGASGRPRG